MEIRGPFKKIPTLIDEGHNNHLKWPLLLIRTSDQTDNETGNSLTSPKYKEGLRHIM